MSSEESERQRRLGHFTRQKVTHAHAVQLETDKDSEKNDCKTRSKNKVIEELSEKVESLTKMVESLTAKQTFEPGCECTYPKQKARKTVGPPCCPNCRERGANSCNHCFICGEAGHRAVGCLKKGQTKNSYQPSADAHSFSDRRQPCTNPSNVHTDELAHVKSNSVTPPRHNKETETGDRVAQLVGKKCKIKCYVHSYAVDCLLDIGAQVSLLDY